jgi:hypothetical protein
VEVGAKERGKESVQEKNNKKLFVVWITIRFFFAYLKYFQHTSQMLKNSQIWRLWAIFRDQQNRQNRFVLIVWTLQRDFFFIFSSTFLLFLFLSLFL